ncbi:MAG: CRISPR-associated endonuclease Cas1 [Bacteroidales bacterium]|nr:CRISPR-associated endonuclease Cas1 [Bacteroidales bacterium]
MELVLNSYGVSLHRDQESFVVSNSEGRQKIPAEGIISIQVSRGAQITSDAVMLAIEREIEILFVGKDGTVFGRVWSPKYGSISTIRKGQLNFAMGHRAVEWIKDILVRKIDNQQALLLATAADDTFTQNRLQTALRRLEDYRHKITLATGEVISDVTTTLRGWEGVASKIYFEQINLSLPEKYRFTTRSQHPATDVANAMLNYGYGILYGKIEGSLIKAGIDPYIGVMHRDDYNRPVLVFDVIEQYRIWVDFVVFNLLQQNAVSEEYYSLRSDGSCWLEPLGRRVVIQSLNDYMEEIVDQHGVSRSRTTQLTLYAQKLASLFKTL